MSPETTPENPFSRQSVITALQVAGDMLFTGYQMGWKAMTTPSHLPDRDALVAATLGSPDFSRLTDTQQSALITRFQVLMSTMSDRAALQTRFNYLSLDDHLSQAFTNQLLRDRFTPGSIKLQWGLLSTALIAQPSAYKVFTKIFDTENSIGFLYPYGKDKQYGHLTFVQADSDSINTLKHEDVHSFQQEFDLFHPLPDYRQLLGSDSMIRLVTNHFETADISAANQVLNHLSREAEFYINKEYAPHLWTHELLKYNIFDEKLYSYSAAITMAFDIYSVTGQTPADKIKYSLIPRLAISGIDHSLACHNFLSKAAVKQYPQDSFAWEKVAARATVLPLNASLSLKRQVLLDHPDSSFAWPESLWPKDLSRALVVYASRAADPAIFDRSTKSQVLLPDAVAQFSGLLIAQLRDPSAYQDLIGGIDLSFRWAKLKSLLVEQAALFIPPGSKNKFRKDFSKEIAGINCPIT